METLKDQKNGISLKLTKFKSKKFKDSFTFKEGVDFLHSQKSLKSILNNDEDNSILLLKLLINIDLIKEESMEKGVSIKNESVLSIKKTEPIDALIQYTDIKMMWSLVNSFVNLSTISKFIAIDEELKDYKENFNKEKKTFYASDLVDWITMRFNLNKSSSIKVGKLLQLNFMIENEKDLEFDDGEVYFYLLVPEKERFLNSYYLLNKIL
jgi:hypothetical protein